MTLIRHVCPSSAWPAAKDMKWTPAALNRDQRTEVRGTKVHPKALPFAVSKAHWYYCDQSHEPTSIRYINKLICLHTCIVYRRTHGITTTSSLRFSCNSFAGICSVMQAEHCNTESKNQFLYRCLFLTSYETTLRIFIIRTSVLALSLLVFWVFADYSDATLSLNDFALFTNWFYRRSNLHFISLLSKKVHLL